MLGGVVAVSGLAFACVAGDDFVCSLADRLAFVIVVVVVIVVTSGSVTLRLAGRTLEASYALASTILVFFIVAAGWFASVIIAGVARA